MGARRRDGLAGVAALPAGAEQRSKRGRRVGPDGQCTSAAWSPDGEWMYFSSNSTGAFHLWRQRFPDGTPEQLTHGPTEEEGIAPDPDGRSVLTSVGTRHRSIWVHDERGEREVSREGYALCRPAPTAERHSRSPGMAARCSIWCARVLSVFRAGENASGELWATDLETGRHRSILPGRQVIGYDVSRDGTQSSSRRWTNAAPLTCGWRDWIVPIRLGDSRSSKRTALGSTPSATSSAAALKMAPASSIGCAKVAHLRRRFSSRCCSSRRPPLMAPG